MGLIRPATPGFLVTLTATIILAVVSFGVPYFKSVYFLKASLAVANQNGSVIFGTLGYCLELSNGTTCSKPSIGYEFDINALVGDKISFAQIPTIAVKWVTYALVLHVVALVLAAISAVFGLLAHVREMSMTCCSTCISGFAAAAAMFAFIFDLVFFFLAKSRLNKVQNGQAQMGIAIWLTLAAWIMLFFSGCFYALGRCCVSRRPRGPSKAERYAPGNYNNSNAQDDALRMQAIKAEADRKALQKHTEGGLPAFHEYEHVKPAETQPLTARVDGDEVYVDEEATPQSYGNQKPAQQFAGGYAPAPAGNRTIDQYYDGPRRQPSATSAQTSATTYPPQPQSQLQTATSPPIRQGSGHAQATSGYSPSSGAASAAALGTGAMVGAAASQYNRNQYLTAGSQYGGQQQQPSGVAYGHGQDTTSYHSASSHQQHPSSYSLYDPYAPQQPQPQSYYNTGVASQTTGGYGQSAMMMPSATGTSYGQNYNNAQPNQPSADRSYTLGGSGYGASVVPALHDTHTGTSSPGPGYMPYPGDLTHSPSPVQQAPTPPHVSIAAASAYQSGQAASSKAPMVTSPTQMHFEDSPPGYEGPLGGVQPAANPGWDAKR